jgi:hypothetical protein
MWPGWQVDAILLGLWLLWMGGLGLQRPRGPDGTPRRRWRALGILGLLSAGVVMLIGMGWHVQVARYGSP